MSRITYKYIKKFDEKDIEKLYEDTGWTNYTKNISELTEAIEASLIVVSAWDIVHHIVSTTELASALADPKGTWA